MKKFFPDICPECGSKTLIEFGKKDDVIKLKCSNVDCVGTFLKRLQKGVIALDIPGLKDATIEKLYDAGVRSVFDIFDKNIINKENLTKSGVFKDGRSLDKLLNSINSVKSLTIDKIILSLQFKDVGESVSKEFGKMFSGLNYSTYGLNKDACQRLIDKESMDHKKVLKYIQTLLDNGIEVEYYKEKVKTIEKKKIVKNVDFDLDFNTIGVDENTLIKQLSWNKSVVQNDDCNLLVVDMKDKVSDKVSIAKEKNIKIITFELLKILYL